MPELSCFPAEVARELWDLGRIRSVGRGECVFELGGAWTGLPVLIDGLARLVTPTQDGQEHLVDLVGPGLAPWWSEALVDAPPSASLEGVRSLVFAELPLRPVRRALDAHPDAWVKLAATWAADYRRMTEQVVALRAPTVPRRLAGTLLHLGRTFGDLSAGDVGGKIKRADLARMAATTPETASRLIALWEDQGVLVRSKRQIRVLDLEALRAIARGGDVDEEC